MPPALEVWSFNYWTTREVPGQALRRHLCCHSLSESPWHPRHGRRAEGGQRKDPVRMHSCKPDTRAISRASLATVSDPSPEPTEHSAVVAVAVTAAPEAPGWWL